MTHPKHVRIVEVGPRDGLQNESATLSVATRVALVEKLVAAGLRHVEVGSFVSPKWVPQMAASDGVFATLDRRSDTTYSALTPNMRGFENALAANVTEVAIFAAASESFSQANINCSVLESLERFRPVIAAAQANRIPVRGYVSCVLGCPYEGVVSTEAVLSVTTALVDMGCYEVSLGDTIGTGTPGTLRRLLDELLRDIMPEQLALHCHDTYGQAIANISAGLDYGIATVDASVAGLGGCPYAKGASGNVATEDVLYLLAGLGIDTGIDLAAVVAIGHWICKALGRNNQSKVATALGDCQ
jgi:hydroxymethylglutaryl-CoA lyase